MVDQLDGKEALVDGGSLIISNSSNSNNHDLCNSSNNNVITVQVSTLHNFLSSLLTVDQKSFCVRNWLFFFQASIKFACVPLGGQLSG
jgi:hypothetical protein